MEWQVFTVPVPDTSGLEPVDPKKFREVLEREIPKDWIRYKDVGNGVERPYVPGWRLQQLVDEATDGRYIWEILGIHYRKANDRVMKPRRGENGTATPVPQPPYVVVVGRLTIPGIGTRVGIGTDVLWDSEDATGQSNAFKAAATDAFKVAAMKFGFARELYTIEGSEEPAEPSRYENGRHSFAQRPQAAQRQNRPAEQGKPQPSGGGQSKPISSDQIIQLNYLRRQLKVSTDEQLNRLIAEWGAKVGNGAKTRADLNGDNIGSFLTFLQSLQSKTA